MEIQCHPIHIGGITIALYIQVMSITTFKVGRQEFVIMPRREYDRVAARLAEDADDVRKAKAALAQYKKSKRGITLEELKREMS